MTAMANVLLSAVIHFSGVVSLSAPRLRDGSTVFLPANAHLHQDGIPLRTSVAFPQANAEQQEQAESLSAIMQALNYVGVIWRWECFYHAGRPVNQ